MRLFVAVAACASTLLATSNLSAAAVGPNAVLTDCNAHAQLTHNYTLTQLRHALAVMPAAFKEYGNCQDVIQAAIIKVKAGKTIVADSGSGGSFLPTPVIVILVVLVLAAATFAALAVRRHRMGPGSGSGDGDPPGQSPPPPAGAD